MGESLIVGVIGAGLLMYLVCNYIQLPENVNTKKEAIFKVVLYWVKHLFQLITICFVSITLSTLSFVADELSVSYNGWFNFLAGLGNILTILFVVLYFTISIISFSASGMVEAVRRLQ
jgi:hypothetical protein